ncbi:hypothetical protein QAD02_013580 [Eretmocerus hayati]|uniref:Uncharacterized protein n=1 Tax=Eretmocerus hayati TaxID=131215 RepID=A0ACC2P3W9_9HYME|nr:hypothetical protein QAD02_013580 [Eretmocerus hayati]
MPESTSASSDGEAAVENRPNSSTPTVVDLLNSWGLQEYVEVFTRNKIPVDHLRSLDDKELMELMTLLGDRLIFKQNRDEHFKNPRKRKNLAVNKKKEVTLKVRSEIFDSSAVLAQLKPLETILKENPLTQSIIVNYESKKILTEAQRTLIVDTVTKELLKITKKADDFIFKNIALRIVEQFPTETIKTYWISPIKKENSKKGESEPPSGRVPNKWRNFQARLRKDLDYEDHEPEQTIQTSVEGIELYEEERKWFEENCSFPIDTVLERFKKSAAPRLQSFRSHRNNVEFVFGTWRIMIQPEAFKLVRSDYDDLKLTKQNPTIEDWERLIDALKQVFREKNQDANIKALLSVLEKSGVKEDHRVRAQPELMCRFVPPTKVVRPTRAGRKSGEETWKASVADSYNSIVADVKLASGIEDLRADRKSDIMTAGRPYIITTGADAKEPEHFYVCTDKALYKVDTFFNALKTCSEAYHVFCVDYPPASEHLWLILQKAFFGFTVNEETSLSNVETVVKSLSVLLGNSDVPSFTTCPQGGCPRYQLSRERGRKTSVTI